MRDEMLGRWVIHSEHLCLPGTAPQPGWVEIDGPRVRSVGTGSVPQGRIVDVGERYIAPGFLDLHVHGGGGSQVNGADPAQVVREVDTLATFHARHGTTSLLATTMSDTTARLSASLRGIAAAESVRAVGSRVLGAHLEGPWLSPERAGAQRRDVLRTPTTTELHEFMDAAPGTVRMITIAPERPGAMEVIRVASSRGVVMSIGHTSADAATTREAFGAGARHVTHLFNAMPGLHHRDPGPVGVALADDRVTVEVIADGHHVAPEMLLLVGRAAPGRVVAVTDAMAAAGCADGDYPLGRLLARVGEGRATLVEAPQTLAGSIATMDSCVATLVRAGISVQDAIGAASSVPAGVIEAPAGIGSIVPGGVADLTVLGDDLRCLATLIGGRVIWDPGGLLDPDPRNL